MVNKIRYRLVWNHNNHINRRGEGLVEVECQQHKKKCYFSTHVYLKPGQFKNGLVVDNENNGQLSFYLYKFMREIESIELAYIVKDVDFTLSMLKEAVRTHVNPSAKLSDFGREVVRGSKRGDLTQQNYNTLFNNIEKFRKNVYINDVDYQFIVSYDKWLQNSGIKTNTRISRLRQLRAILNEAVAREFIQSNPFERFRIPQSEPKKCHLTEKELMLLENAEVEGEEKIVRDAFLIGCYTGLRFSDVVTLNQEEIIDGWLKKKTKKTGAYVEIPVGEIFDGKIYNIINQYKNNIRNLTRKIGTNAVTNKKLKDIFKRLGIREDATFHTSRHTFATLLANKGVALDVISKMLGHAKLQTTEIYREIDRTSITNAIRGATKTD